MDLNSKKTLLILFPVIFLVGIFLFVDGLPSLKNAIFYKQNLKFSNTQKWDSEIYSMMRDDVFFVGDPFGEKNEFPPPPKNLSAENKKELEELINLQKERTLENEKEILLEVYITTMRMGPYFYSDFTESSKIFTKQLFDLFIPEFLSILVRHKEHFDRVRPSFLDTSIRPSVGIPGHPAYPSGHASQSFLVASIASELDPQNREKYFESAFRIAKNREIAGVHYKSDSEAGQFLAEEYLKLLFKNERFLSVLELAKSEW